MQGKWSVEWEKAKLGRHHYAHVSDTYERWEIGYEASDVHSINSGEKIQVCLGDETYDIDDPFLKNFHYWTELVEYPEPPEWHAGDGK